MATLLGPSWIKVYVRDDKLIILLSLSEIYHSDIEPVGDPIHKSHFGSQARDTRDSKNSMRDIHSANTNPAHGRKDVRKKIREEQIRNIALVLFLAGGLNVRLR
jgi:hypothetical protein